MYVLRADSDDQPVYERVPVAIRLSLGGVHDVTSFYRFGVSEPLL